jgi:hypothetical protein
MWKAVHDGINPERGSESEQEREPYGGHHSAAIDHSVGNSRRRVGFLLGSCLSSPLALANSKHKTLVRCTTRRDRLVRPTESAKRLRYTSLSHSREALALQRVLNTYLVRYSLVAFDRRLDIDSIKAPWSSRHALDIESDRVSMCIADFVVSNSIRRASTFERY